MWAGIEEDFHRTSRGSNEKTFDNNKRMDIDKNDYNEIIGSLIII